MAIYNHRLAASFNRQGRINWPSILGILSALFVVATIFSLRPNQPLGGDDAPPIADSTPSAIASPQNTPVVAAVSTATATQNPSAETDNNTGSNEQATSTPTQVALSTAIATFTLPPGETRVPETPQPTVDAGSGSESTSTSTGNDQTTTDQQPAPTVAVAVQPTSAPTQASNTSVQPTNTTVSTASTAQRTSTTATQTPVAQAQPTQAQPTQPPARNVGISLLSPFQNETVKSYEVQLRVQVNGFQNGDRLQLRAGIDQNNLFNEGISFGFDGSAHVAYLNYQPGGFGFGQTYLWQVLVIGPDGTTLATSGISQFRWEDPAGGSSNTAVPPTQPPPPPTAVPPTAVPPTAVPPTAVPPTAVPPTAVPPTAVPPTAVPPTQLPLPTEPPPPTAVPPTQPPPPPTPVPGPRNIGVSFLSPAQNETVKSNEVQLRVQVNGFENGDRLQLRASIDRQNWFNEGISFTFDGSAHVANLNYQPGNAGFGRDYYWQVLVIRPDGSTYFSNISQFRWEQPGGGDGGGSDGGRDG